MLKSGHKWQPDCFLCTPDAAASKLFFLLCRCTYYLTMSSSSSLTETQTHLHNTKFLQFLQFSKHFKTSGVLHRGGVAIYIQKSIILRQKMKNYGNSNIPPFKNIIFQKNPLKKQPKTFQDIIITL
jgi:hypothetical protein